MSRRNSGYSMTARCCVCGCKAEGVIVCGEFVCLPCHYEATGERPPKQVSLRQVKPRKTRRQIRDELIAEHLKNKMKEKRNEK